MKPLGSKIKERCGDWVRTLQVVGYNSSNTHEVYEVVHEEYSPMGIDYVSLIPKKYEL